MMTPGVPPGTCRARGNLPHREPAPLRGKWPNSGLVRNWAHMPAIRELDSTSKWELFVVAQESTILNLPSSRPWEMSTLSETQVPRLRSERKPLVWGGEPAVPCSSVAACPRCVLGVWSQEQVQPEWVRRGHQRTWVHQMGRDALPPVRSTEGDGERTDFWPEDGNCFQSGCRDISAGAWCSLYIIWWPEWSLISAFGQPVVQGIHLGAVLLGKYGTGGSYGLGANQLWIETSLKNSHVWDQRCGSVDRILG